MAVKRDKVAGTSDGPADAIEADSPTDDRKICGIVMPIAAMGEDYPEAHWGRVRRVLQRAIDRAGLRSQLVWENPEVDVIQTAILQNLYENDVVVCDVSNLNPNVMLETGLRLSTKRPTIIVTDRVIRPPFDISTIAYIDYPRDLEYNATEDFIGKLTRKIMDVTKAAAEDRYHSYIEQFRFETVEPAKITVTTDEYLRERLDDLAASVRRLTRNQERGQASPRAAPSAPPPVRYSAVDSVVIDIDEDNAREVEYELDKLAGLISTIEEAGHNKWRFTLSVLDPKSTEAKNSLEKARSMLERAEAEYVFG